jgi:hypothetical protein
VTKRYVTSLKLSLDRGELGAYEERDLEVIAHLLMSARSYLALRFTVTNNAVRPPPDYVIKAYMRFVAAGLSAPPLSTERNKS